MIHFLSRPGNRANGFARRAGRKSRVCRRHAESDLRGIKAIDTRNPSVGLLERQLLVPLDSVCSRAPTDFVKRTRKSLHDGFKRRLASIFGNAAVQGVTQKPTSLINQRFHHN
jgi:hypothetical protein